MNDFKPVGDYGLMADCNSAALLDRAGSIDWLCLPRYDELLGNFPQAFSHIGLITAAWEIDKMRGLTTGKQEG